MQQGHDVQYLSWAMTGKKDIMENNEFIHLAN